MVLEEAVQADTDFLLPFALEYTEYVPYENVVGRVYDEVIKKIAKRNCRVLNELEKKGFKLSRIVLQYH